MSRDQSTGTFCRRGLLAAGAAASMLAALPLTARAAGNSEPDEPRRLALHNLHTGEMMSAVYWADGEYIQDALAVLSSVCRDHRTGEVRPIDPGVLDLAHAIGQALDSARPVGVISGYRSPKTNARLAERTAGVAVKSLHMQGMALDIRVERRRPIEVYRIARKIRAGGVGIYPRSNFVHIDTGRVRYWRG